MAIVSQYAVCMSFNTKSLCVPSSPATMTAYQIKAGMSLGHSCYLGTWLDIWQTRVTAVSLYLPRNSPDEFQLQFERELGINTFAKQNKGIYTDIIWSLCVYIYIYIHMRSWRSSESSGRSKPHQLQIGKKNPPKFFMDFCVETLRIPRSTVTVLRPPNRQALEMWHGLWIHFWIHLL